MHQEAPDPEVVDVDLTEMAFGGDAIGRVEGKVFFVPYGLPGERVRVGLERRKPDYATARLHEVVQPAPGRIAPPCPYFGQCGGCQWQHATYPLQLAMKRQVVVDQLRRIGGFPSAEELVREPIGMMEPWEYRNHVRFSLGRKYGDVGYTYRQSHRLLPIAHCAIAHPAIDTVLSAIQRRCAGLRAHQITVRYGCNTGALLVNPALPMVPELETGQLELQEEVLDRRFRISAASFFQVNTRREVRSIPESIVGPWTVTREGLYSMTDLLALLVLDRLQPQPEDTIVDAYSGVGTFSILIAPRCGRVIAIEESPAATRDAQRNAPDVENVRFLTGRIEDVLPSLGQDRIDGLVLDPSRVGCSPAVIRALLDRHPRRLVYVSCDPATLARDLRLLHQGGYTVESVEPIDLFPQTYHVETVTTLARKGA